MQISSARYIVGTCIQNQQRKLINIIHKRSKPNLFQLCTEFQILHFKHKLLSLYITGMTFREYKGQHLVKRFIPNKQEKRYIYQNTQLRILLLCKSSHWSEIHTQINLFKWKIILIMGIQINYTEFLKLAFSNVKYPSTMQSVGMQTKLKASDITWSWSNCLCKSSLMHCWYTYITLLKRPNIFWQGKVWML